MREIKFRGMDVDGNWHYGNLAVLPEDVRHLKKGHYISNEAGLPFAYQVRPDTVGQYTGLNDKNGMEIYKGDIVKHEDFSIGCTVDLNITGAVVMVDGSWCVERGNNGDYLFTETGTNENIGNIYETPELIHGT